MSNTAKEWNFREEPTARKGTDSLGIQKISHNIFIAYLATKIVDAGISQRLHPKKIHYL